MIESKDSIDVKIGLWNRNATYDHKDSQLENCIIVRK